MLGSQFSSKQGAFENSLDSEEITGQHLMNMKIQVGGLLNPNQGYQPNNPQVNNGGF